VKDGQIGGERGGGRVGAGGLANAEVKKWEKRDGGTFSGGEKKMT